MLLPPLLEDEPLHLGFALLVDAFESFLVVLNLLVEQHLGHVFAATVIERLIIVLGRGLLHLVLVLLDCLRHGTLSLGTLSYRWMEEGCIDSTSLLNATSFIVSPGPPPTD